MHDSLPPMKIQKHSPLLITLVTLWIGLASSAIAADKIYWTQEDFSPGTDKIATVNADGSGVDTLLSGANVSGGPIGIAIDWVNEQMYWTQRDGSIRRGDLDGTNRVTLLNGLSQPFGIALDVAGGKMYWAEIGSNSIKRANLNGSNVQTLDSGLGGATFLALDLENGKIYYTQYTGNKVSRMDLDGGNQVDLITAGLNGPDGIAIDVAGGKIYIGQIFGGNIRKANIDGSGIGTIVGPTSNPNGLKLDLVNNRLYWITQAGRIESADLDGSNPQTITTAGTDDCRDLELDFDADGDGTRDPADGCISDPGKSDPGVCGCGVVDADSDADGTFDCEDSCENDANKIEVGVCGCGVPDSDLNQNGFIDCLPEDSILLKAKTIQAKVRKFDPNENYDKQRTKIRKLSKDLKTLADAFPDSGTVMPQDQLRDLATKATRRLRTLTLLSSDDSLDTFLVAKLKALRALKNLILGLDSLT